MLLLFLGSLASLWLTCMLWVAVPAAVAETGNAVAALKRSAALTAGVRWRIIGMMLTLALLWVGVEIALIQATAPNSTKNGFLVEFAVGQEGPISAYMLASLASTVVTGGLVAISSAVAYHDLRVAREGATLEEIASVFD